MPRAPPGPFLRCAYDLFPKHTVCLYSFINCEYLLIENQKRKKYMYSNFRFLFAIVLIPLANLSYYYLLPWQRHDNSNIIYVLCNVLNNHSFVCYACNLTLVSSSPLSPALDICHNVIFYKWKSSANIATSIHQQNSKSQAKCQEGHL